MDPFLVRDIFEHSHYVGILDAKGRPRKIKPSERCILYAIANCKKCSLDLAVSFSKSVLKKESGSWGFRKEDEQGLRVLFERERELNILELSKICALTYKTTWKVVNWLIENAVIDKVSFQINLNRFSGAY